MEGYLRLDKTRLLPFLWVKGEGEEALRQGVRDACQAGCGAVCAESRTHPDFLGEGWWRDVGILLDECKRHDMKLWVLDDMHFPSGYAAGTATGTPYARMMMTERHMDVRGPVRGGAFVVADDEHALRPGEGVVAVIAARRLEESNLVDAFEDIGGYKLDQLTDLTDTVRDGMAYWDVPEGMWRVFVLTAAFVTERTPPRSFANPLLPDSARLMIEAIYQPHYDHFAADFGKTFMGFFSDEPGLRAGRGYHGVLGEYPRIPIPWRPDMMALLMAEHGADLRRLLPGLWYDVGEKTGWVRFAVMDTVSRLYGECYCAPLGQWCRAHGVSYIGHVIEQNNTHCRLGSGAGHFFRAIGGQDMAGFDIVLHEIRPELRGGTHAWHSQGYEADDDFFRYMLMQMSVSAAHLDKKKRGRTMCEIFGAYGWQEDAGEMRYLANLTLSRGVNYFVPHAFTLEQFPDRDSPPHFDRAHNPLMPAISRIFGHMARVGSLIDGGRQISRTAVLYYGEAEWACGTTGCMKTQAVVKALNQRQIECQVVPIDALLGAEFDALLIPYARRWPKKLLDCCRELLRRGRRVAFVDAAPEALSQGEGDMAELLAGMDVVPLCGAADYSAKHAPLMYRQLRPAPWVHLYPYRRDGDVIFLLFNEDDRNGASVCLDVDDARQAYCLDSENELCWALPGSDGSVTRVELDLEPAQLLAVVFTDAAMPTQPAPRPLRRVDAFSAGWDISLRAMGEEAFKPYPYSGVLPNITAPDALPRFSGTVRYEAQLELPEGCAAIELGDCSGTARLWLDGRSVGWRSAGPYLFRFAPVEAGAHSVRVEITNAAVHAHRDALSFFGCVRPTGMLGPATLYTEE